MTRMHAQAAVLMLGTASVAVGQPARVVGPSGPGAQPQVVTGAYQRPTTAPAARGVNPFAAPAAPVVPPGTRLAPRGGAPVAFAPPPAPGVPNNPGVFNPGMPPPFPVLVPPGALVLPAAYNPLFVSRRGVVSAYYSPPATIRSPGSDEFTFPADPEAGPAFVPPTGESRFLPWVW